jgi:hypothetical protein
MKQIINDINKPIFINISNRRYSYFSRKASRLLKLENYNYISFFEDNGKIYFNILDKHEDDSGYVNLRYSRTNLYIFNSFQFNIKEGKYFIDIKSTTLEEKLYYEIKKI